jgi:hypothetical protein
MMGPSPILILRLFLAALAGFAGMPAYAQTTSGTINVSVVTSLSLVKTDDLNFANTTPTGAAGTVTVSPTGARTATGGAILAGGTPTAAGFAGLGARNQQVRISFGAASITLNRAGGGASMTADTFTLQALVADGLTQIGAGNGPPRYRITSNSGLFSFTVGARLNVGSNQPGGVYTGTFNVTADYQ